MTIISIFFPIELFIHNTKFKTFETVSELQRHFMTKQNIEQNTIFRTDQTLRKLILASLDLNK